MIFTPHECETLIELLADSYPEDFTFLNPETAEKLLNSSLKKLENISGITYFTKQELTLIADAVVEECKFYALYGGDAELELLRDKLLSLSEHK